MHIKEWITDEFSRKYKYASDLYEMITSEEDSNFLNPAYNKKYKSWLNDKKEEMNKDVEMTEVYNIEGIDKYILPTFDFIGTGAVGSNLLYMLENVRYVKIESNISEHIPFMEYDSWELSNLPRIPFKPRSIDKKESIIKEGLGYSEKLEKNITEPIFLELCNDKHANVIPIGAMDVESRKVLFDCRIPFIAITHKDNELTAVLCPKPAENLELINESYGIIDINFLLPAIHMASEEVYKMMHARDSNNEYTDVMSKIDEYKINFAKIKEKLLYKNSEKYAMGNLYYNYKYNSPEEIHNNISSIFEWTFRSVAKLFNDRAGIEEIIRYSKIKRPSDEYLDNIEYPDFDSLVDTHLFTISEDDVAEYLKDYYENNR